MYVCARVYVWCVCIVAWNLSPKKTRCLKSLENLRIGVKRRWSIETIEVNARSKFVYDLHGSFYNVSSMIVDTRFEKKKDRAFSELSLTYYILSNKGTSDHRKKDNSTILNLPSRTRDYKRYYKVCSTTSKRVLWFVSCTKHTKYAGSRRRAITIWYRSMCNHHRTDVPIPSANNDEGEELFFARAFRFVDEVSKLS